MLMLLKRYESTEVDRRTWLHVSSGPLWSTSNDIHQVQLILYIAVNEGSTEKWPLYTGDLYIEVEPIWKLQGIDIKAIKFGF